MENTAQELKWIIAGKNREGKSIRLVKYTKNEDGDLSIPAIQLFVKEFCKDFNITTKDISITKPNGVITNFRDLTKSIREAKTQWVSLENVSDSEHNKLVDETCNILVNLPTKMSALGLGIEKQSQEFKTIHSQFSKTAEELFGKIGEIETF